MLTALSPAQGRFPAVVVLTPGIYNSAYFEHAYLAQQMGCELVEGRDLAVGDDECVYMQTIRGWSASTSSTGASTTLPRPGVFRKDSALGVPGLMRAWRAGNVALANAPGAGVADDKVVYAYVPEMIKYYLGEDAILPNVPTLLLRDDEQPQARARRSRPAGGQTGERSGGYGMLIGPLRRRRAATMAAAVEAEPAQLHRAAGARAVDGADAGAGRARAAARRPAALHPAGPRHQRDHGRTHARRAAQGSLVVNSSQGGGSKDTWIVAVKP